MAIRSSFGSPAKACRSTWLKRLLGRSNWVPTERFGCPSVPDFFLEFVLLLAHLSGDVVAELFLDVLLGLGIEVGHVKQPAHFDHFDILSGNARGPFERLFARLHLDDPVAANHFLGFGKWTVGHFR